MLIDISIHAPLTGSDASRRSKSCDRSISIHAPLTGSDLTRTSLPWFLVNFNPRSPYGERQLRKAADDLDKIFQSTLPLRGATCLLIDCKIQVRFQSTLPLRGATGAEQKRVWTFDISIHAPLTGSDVFDVCHFAQH